MLDDKFNELMTQAGVDLKHYTELTQRVSQALVGPRSPNE